MQSVLSLLLFAASILVSGIVSSAERPAGEPWLQDEHHLVVTLAPANIDLKTSDHDPLIVDNEEREEPASHSCPAPVSIVATDFPTRYSHQPRAPPLNVSPLL